MIHRPRQEERSVSNDHGIEMPWDGPRARTAQLAKEAEEVAYQLLKVIHLRECIGNLGASRHKAVGIHLRLIRTVGRLSFCHLDMLPAELAKPIHPTDP
jgi:hypothetical protein